MNKPFINIQGLLEKISREPIINPKYIILRIHKTQYYGRTEKTNKTQSPLLDNYL